MKTNRRSFLKFSGLTGMMMTVGNITTAIAGDMRNKTINGYKSSDPGFNMCGYAAPKLEKVRIGFIGLGNRGPGAVMRTSKIEGVDIRALCDLRPEKSKWYKKEIAGSNTGF